MSTGERRFSLKRTIYSVMLDGKDLVLLCTPCEPVVLKDISPFSRELLTLLAESRTTAEITGALNRRGHQCSFSKVKEELDRLNDRLLLEVEEDLPTGGSASGNGSGERGELSTENGAITMAELKDRPSSESAARNDPEVRNGPSKDSAVVNIPVRDDFSKDSAAIDIPAGRHDRTRLWFAARKPCGTPFALSAEKTLQTAHIALFGLGGLGSQLFTQLLLTGIGEITTVDCENVEESNLDRQSLFYESDVGHLKTEAAAERARLMNSSAALHFIEKRIASADDFAEIMASASIALLAADTPRDRIFGWMNEACYRTGVPVLFTNGVLQSSMGIGPLVIPGRTACFQCSMPPGASFDDPLVQLINRRHCHGVILPSLAVCAGLMATELLRHLTGCEPCRLYDRRLHVDIRDYRMWFQEIEKHNGCPFCGERAP
ncbi:MAG: ThiF family adenylyltransferase [Vulcanimicrobiota bacterium]